MGQGGRKSEKSEGEIEIMGANVTIHIHRGLGTIAIGVDFVDPGSGLAVVR